jgi:hypothetical protein
MPERLLIVKKPYTRALRGLDHSLTIPKLLNGCIGKRDRECLYRLIKEACIRDQNFDAAVIFRDLQMSNKPLKRKKIKEPAHA